MAEALEHARSSYLDELDMHGSPLTWAAAINRRGIEAFEAHGFPHAREESWRKVDLTPVRERHFPRVEHAGAVPEELARRAAGIAAAHRLVFVDGRFHPGLSEIGELPEGLTVTPLSAYEDAAPEMVTESLGAVARLTDQPFAALNTGMFADGAFVHVARGMAVEQPVSIVHVTTADADGHAVYPRVLVRVEEAAEARIIEHYVGAEDTTALVVPVTEVDSGDAAVVHHYRIQEEGESSLHIGVLAGRTGRDGDVRMHSVTAGARLFRLDAVGDIAGTGANVTLNGLYLTRNRQFADHHTWMNHREPHGTSRQLFKGVLRGRSETVFDGLVKVFEGAQKTDAVQENRNLILDKLALAHSNPRLEIYADDVKCTHGSTTGQLEEEALFYLRSRGIGQQDAQGMLTLAFAAEMLEELRLEAVHDHVRALLLARLPGDDTLRDAV